MSIKKLFLIKESQDIQPLNLTRIEALALVEALGRLMNSTKRFQLRGVELKDLQRKIKQFAGGAM